MLAWPDQGGHAPKWPRQTQLRAPTPAASPTQSTSRQRGSAALVADARTATHQWPASHSPISTARSVESPTARLRILRHTVARAPAISIASFAAAFIVFCLIGAAVFDADTSPIGWAVTVLWSLPAVGSAVGLWGVLQTRRRWGASATGMINHDPLIVVVPTIGRHDVLPALTRTVKSFVDNFPDYHSNFRIDVVCEEFSPARAVIEDQWGSHPYVRVLAVPASYTTQNKTGFKARANQYVMELRRQHREADDRTWILHMDDDTSCTRDTAAKVADFVCVQNDPATVEPKHLAQGVLTYPREFGVNAFTWLADAVRPSDDLSRFAALTGTGTPLAGLHGELMLVRSSIEDSIGWDFGPKTIVEDAQWALNFSRLHPGRSAWIPACSYGASPSNVRSFVAQRERWAWGLAMLVVNRSIPFRHRVFLAYSVSTWVIGPFQHVGVIFGAAYITNESVSPASIWITGLWGINVAYIVWMYWTGLRVNHWASRRGAARWWRYPLVITLIPVFTLIEGWAGFKGLLCVLRRKQITFTVIQKEA